MSMSYFVPFFKGVAPRFRTQTQGSYNTRSHRTSLHSSLLQLTESMQYNLYHHSRQDGPLVGWAPTCLLKGSMIRL